MKNKYIIYARDNCPFCDTLLNFMKENDQKFIYVLCYNVEDNLREIMEQHNWKTVPLVIELEEGDEKAGRLIGGCEDTIEYIERNRPRADTIPDSGED